MRRLSCWMWLIVLMTQSATPVYCHPAPYSYLDLRISPTAVEATLTAHTQDLAHELNVTPPEALLDQAQARQESLLHWLRSRLALSADGGPLAVELLRIEPLPDRQALALHLRFAAPASIGRLVIQCSLFPYDPQHQTFLNIYESDALVRQEVLNQQRATLDHFTGTLQGTRAAMRTFFFSGIQHIFAGADHILFLIGLLLLGGSVGRLLVIVTAFTLAHSLTLTLAAFNLANPSPRIIEAAIALSIVYVGIDNLLVKEASRDARAIIALFFGLVHGFGFANVLREFGLPRHALGWSLFSFNLGVTVCSVCIVMVAASVLSLVRQRHPALNRRVVLIGSIGVIVIGVYWFVQRVLLG